MGTRSLTHIKQDDETLVTIYRQMDGYPSGMGAELKSIAGGIKIVNGFQPGSTDGPEANGMGCLAAQVIEGLKDGIGGVYVYPVDSADCGENYTYTLWDQGGRVHVKCEEVYDKAIVYEGPLADWNCADT